MHIEQDISRIRATVEQILGDGGVAYHSGMVRREIQYQYALSVVEVLCAGHAHANGKSVNIEQTMAACIEGGTGIGKTVGYLVPALAFSAITGKRVAVSTYTHALQKQLISHDLPLVAEWISQATGISLSYACRFGSTAYISADRTEMMVHALLNNSDNPLSEHQQNELNELLSWAKASLDEGSASGLIVDYLMERGLSALPAGLRESDICLSATDNDLNRQRLLDGIAASKQVDVLVVTHAMALLNNRSFYRILDEDRKIRAMIFDEADQLDSAAANIFTEDLSLHKMRRNLSKLSSELPSVNKCLETLDTFIKHLQEVSSRRPYIVVSDDASHGPVLAKQVQHLNTVALPIQKTLDKLRSKPSATASTIGLYNEIISQILTISSFVATIEDRTNMSTGMIRLSPVKRYPSLHVVPLYPGRLVSRLWAGLPSEDEGKSNYIESAIFTSATLGVLNRHHDFDYGDFARSVGLFADEQGTSKNGRLKLFRDLCESFEPDEFGKSFLVLADPSLPNPLQTVEASSLLEDGEEEIVVEYNRTWLQYAEKMIRYAIENPSSKLTYNRTLILCNGYKDVHTLKEMFSNTPYANDFIFHLPGSGYTQYLDAFKANPNAILVTPSAWEGLSLPNTIANLCIFRLPITPPNNSLHDALRVYYSAKGVSDAIINRIAIGLARTGQKRRLKQGAGRGNRCDTDYVRILISDPRFIPACSQEYPDLELLEYEFPVSSYKRKSQGFEYSLPKRLRRPGGAYERANIFMRNGEMNRLRKRAMAYS